MPNPANCGHAAAAFMNAGRSVTLAGLPLVSLGVVFAFRPDAIPIDVWLTRELTAALQGEGLWCEGTVLTLDGNALEEVAADEAEVGQSIPQFDVPFVVWAQRPLYSGVVEVDLERAPYSPAPDRDYAAYWPAQAIEARARLTHVGADAGSPSEGVYEQEDEPLPWGCRLTIAAAIAGVIAVIVLAAVGAFAAWGWFTGL